MLGLPTTTEFNKEIDSDKFLVNARAPKYLRDVFDDQIDTVIWTNKISRETAGIIPGKHFSEMEVLRIDLKKNALDKRALSCLDKSIPYYVLFLQQYCGNYQIWLGDKIFVRRGSLKVNNYFRTRWISVDDFIFPIMEKTLDDVYLSCVEKISDFSYSRGQKTYWVGAESFIDYCRNMLMTYSYKPLLILALIQNGGCLSVEDIARYYQAYYLRRKAEGLIIEKGGCIFAEESSTLSALERNVIINPINALMNSGLFEYDSDKRLFNIKNEIYDSLTLEQVSIIENVCKQRLYDYFFSIQ